MSAPENSIPVEVLDAAINGWFGTVPETKNQQHFRHCMRAALAEAQWTAPAAGGALDALDADLIEILGRPNFMCADLATRLRAGGHSIKTKAEHEQAAVIHFLLGHYLKHGSDWRNTAGSAFDAIAQPSQRKEA